MGEEGDVPFIRCFEVMLRTPKRTERTSAFLRGSITSFFLSKRFVSVSKNVKHTMLASARQFIVDPGADSSEHIRKRDWNGTREREREGNRSLSLERFVRRFLLPSFQEKRIGTDRYVAVAFPSVSREILVQDVRFESRQRFLGSFQRFVLRTKRAFASRTKT